MTFDRFCTTKFTTTLDGNEIIGLYLTLSCKEENLDHHQRRTLESLRSLLYANLSIEELEDLKSIFCFNQKDRPIT